MRTQNKKILFLLGMSVFILVGLFSFSTAAFAEIKYTPLAPIDGYVEEMSITPDSFSDYLNNMFKLGIALCTALAVLMIIVGGIQYVSSDAWSKKSDGKERIFAALFGLLIAFGSWALLNTIDPRLLSTKLTLQEVTIEGIPTHGPGSGGGTFTETDPNYKPEEQKPGVNIPGCTNQSAPTSGKATLYYVASESDYGGSKTAAFLDQNGNSLGAASPEFLAAARIEGTAKLANGTVLNYASGSGTGIKWKVTNTPYGEGSKGNALVPYRTVAADPSYYSFGQKVYIRELDGMNLPDGTTHNGFVTVGDVGSAIKGPGRFDIFTGAGKNSGGNVNSLSNRNITTSKCQ